MSEKIEMEVVKLRSANSLDYNKIFWSSQIPLGKDKRTSSTLLLKQPNSLEVDRAALRKTRSEENMGYVAPKIIIGNLPTTTTVVTCYCCCLDKASPGSPIPFLMEARNGGGLVSLEVPTITSERW